MAPEQAKGEVGHPLAQADVYSLGALLYQLLTGMMVFRGETPVETLRQVIHDEPVPPSRLRRSVPPDLETICLKCLEKSPTERYSSARELAEDIQRFLRREPIHARPATAFEHLWKFYRRKPLVAFLGTALLLSLIVGLTGISGFWLQSESRRNQAEALLLQATEANTVAVQERTRSERLRYFNQIALADRERFINVARAREILDSCSPDFRNWEWHYLSRFRHPEMVELSGHTLPVMCCQFSRDGEVLASGSGIWGSHLPGEVIVWNTFSGEAIGQPLKHIGQVTGLSFHPTQPWLATSQSSWHSTIPGDVRIWNWKTSEEMVRLEDARSTFDVCFSPDGRILAVAIPSGSVLLYDSADWKKIAEFQVLTGNVFSVDFHPSGTLLAAGGRDGSLLVWDITSKSILFRDDNLTDVRKVKFSRDGRILVCTTFSGRIKSWLVDSFQQLSENHSKAGGIRGIDISPDSSTIAIASATAATEVLNLQTGQYHYTFPGHFLGTRDVSFHADGSLIATCGLDGKVRLWSFVNTHRLQRRMFQSPFLSDLISLPDREWIAAGTRQNESTLGRGSGDFSIRIIDLDRVTQVKRMVGHTNWTTMLDCTADGRFIASASLDGTVRIWDVDEGSCKHVLETDSEVATSCAFIPGTPWVISGTREGAIDRWNFETGQYVDRIGQFESAVTDITASPKGNFLAVGSEQGTCCVWSVKLQSWAGELVGQSCSIQVLEFHPDETLLISGGNDPFIRCWSLSSLQTVSTTTENSNALPDLPAERVFKTPEQQICDLKFLPGGERIVYAGSDFGSATSIRLIDTETGNEALQLALVEERYPSITLARGGKTILYGVNSGFYRFDSDSGAEDIHHRVENWQKERMAWHAQELETAELERNPSKAVFHLQRLIEVQPTNDNYFYRLGNAYGELQLWELAAQAFDECARLRNRPSDQAYFSIIVQNAQGNLEKSQAALRDFVAFNKDFTNASAANQLAWMLALYDHPENDREQMIRAIEFACQNIEQLPASTQNLYFNTKALVLLRLGKVDEAETIIEQAIKAHGNGGTLDDWMIKAYLSRLQGEEAHAENWLRKIRMEMPRNEVRTPSSPRPIRKRWLGRKQVDHLLQEIENLPRQSEDG